MKLSAATLTSSDNAASFESPAHRNSGASALYANSQHLLLLVLTHLDTFPRLVVDGKAEEKDWSATRQTKNANTKQGIENPTVADIRCYSSSNAANVITIPAGATIHYISTQQVNHPGPTQYYLAKVPASADVKTWDGSGAVWFKISTTKPTVDAQKQMTWPGQSMCPSTLFRASIH
ncbi:MAG: hypothetical protein EOO38_17480 [Cytophagaceae bacterium]|nr:MAG: hypothetical protein EOO38_17480 [Cytophagaceae bacterium]